MRLQVDVAEADVAQVRAGLAASFTVDAWPDDSFAATVEKIAFGSTNNNNVVTYRTDLAVKNDELRLRPGMTATAEIVVDERKGVLLVPNAAFRFNPADSLAADNAAPKKSFVQSLAPLPPRGSGRGEELSARPPRQGSVARVWVLDGAEPRAVEVKVGLADDRATEISGEGLREGLPIIVRRLP